MPKPMLYNEKSLIYAQGEEAEKIYLLQSGKVSLVYKDIKTGDDIREPVNSGEFFGVKSSLGRYPREENAIAVADSAVMTFTIPEFELLALSNTRIIIQLLKIFSRQMRQIHAQVASLLETEPVKPEDALFDLGVKFLKNKRFYHARYVFDRYIFLYPEGKDAAMAQKNISLAEVSIVCSENDDKQPQNRAQNTIQNTAAGSRRFKTNAEIEAPVPVLDMGAFTRFAKVFKNDEIFFCEHEPGDNFYLIQSGKVRLVKNTGDVERTLDILHPPEMFGEMALLENSHRTATAIAVGDVTALEFNMQNFEILLNGNPQIAFRLLRIFSKRIYDSKRRFTILTLPDIQAKIAYVFIMLDDTHANIDKSGNSREFQTTIEDIAQWAGLSVIKTRETLMQFASQNRIEISTGRIIVKNINDFIRLVNSRLHQMSAP